MGVAMTKTAKALHPIKVNGRMIRPGGDIDEAAVGARRFSRLLAKGRVSAPGETAPVNRGDTQTGKPDLKLPPDTAKTGQ